jgi:uncharacterized protein
MVKKYVLSIDGGGIKGIIPACALVKLEQATGKLARETFSFVGGTSTGAIIAAGIAAGVPAERILNLYMTRARDLMPRRLWHPLKRIVFGSFHSTKNLHALLDEHIAEGRSGQEARGWTLNDSPIDLLITATTVPDGIPWYFVKDRPGKNSSRTGNLNLVHCVTASAAAPTIFHPWTIPENPARLPAGWEPIGPLVDGGVGIAGNPVYVACVEAFFYTGEYSPEETIVVSLGTGHYPHRKRPTWIWPWLRWILAELLDSPGEQQTELVQRHFVERLPSDGPIDMPFFRIDTELKRDISMEDSSATEELREIGERLANLINWQEILANTDTEFRISQQKTLWKQYRKPVI